MEQTIAKRIPTEQPQSWFSQTAERIFFSALRGLPKGQLLLTDHNGRQFVFGSSTSGDQLRQADLIIEDPKLYSRVIFGGSIGFAEAYIDKQWHTSDLTALLRIFAANQEWLDRFQRRFSWISYPYYALRHRRNRNTVKQSKRNIGSHYDLGNRLYKRFLDASMNYSSGIYRSATDSLETAQCAKIERILEQLHLSPEDHLLEIGCGWGDLAIQAAKSSGCRVTTTTISDEQYSYVKQRIKEENLEHKIILLHQDYRHLVGNYDKVVSVEMIEAVGHEYLDGYFEALNHLLKPGGTLVLQSITIADQRLDHYLKNPDFIQTHIFPGGFLPSISLIGNQFRDQTNMVIRDIFDFGESYARTLEDWRERLMKNRDALNDDGYDERFMRLWNYYFCYCEAGFWERAISVVHITATKP